jgi:hypothetical protein
VSEIKAVMIFMKPETDTSEKVEEFDEIFNVSNKDGQEQRRTKKGNLIDLVYFI